MPEKITFNSIGRMNYHPDYHSNHKKPWTTGEQKYLIDNYGKSTAYEISFALERTVKTVMERAYQLRKAGLLKSFGKRGAK